MDDLKLQNNRQENVEISTCGIEASENSEDLGGGNEGYRRGEKRRRTNYALAQHKIKIEEAVKYLLEISDRSRPNVRNVAEKVFWFLSSVRNESPLYSLSDGNTL
jgi:hypothetical protein